MELMGWVSEARSCALSRDPNAYLGPSAVWASVITRRVRDWGTRAGRQAGEVDGSRRMGN